MGAETEFSVSVIVVTGMMTCGFLRGVLLGMRGTSADGVFHLAILALLNTWQALIVFHWCPPRLPVNQKRLLYKF